MPDKISIVVPVLNEADRIQDCLSALQGFRENGHEVIIVDGGSSDRSREMSLPWSDQLIQHKKGRGRQMHTGARFSRGGILLFLHVDTRLPAHANSIIQEAVVEGSEWGYFPVRLSGNHPAFRLIEFMMNIRTRLTGIVTGDHAIFMSRNIYFRTGGYDDIDLMEDIAISHKLRAIAAPFRSSMHVITSSRRWETHGIVRTVLKMWRLRLAYFLGADVATLARQYDIP